MGRLERKGFVSGLIKPAVDGRERDERETEAWVQLTSMIARHIDRASSVPRRVGDCKSRIRECSSFMP